MIKFVYNSPLAQRLLGIPPNLAGKIDKMQMSYAWPWTAMLAGILLASSLLWFSFFYYRDGSRPSWFVKGPLLFLRLIAIAALMLILAQPILRFGRVETVRPSVAILVDNSDSMRNLDPKLPYARAQIESQGTGMAVGDVAGTSRIDRINALLNHNKVLTELSKRYNVRFYTFGGKTGALPLPGDAKKRPAYRFHVTPDLKSGDSTQMGPAIRRPLEELAGQPVAGMLMVSDGGQNLGEDPIYTADAARQAKVPLSTIGIGDPTKTKDVALLSVLADDVVRVNNTVTVYAALSQRGYTGRTIAVSLRRNNEVVGREMVRLGPDDQKQEVHFTYVPQQGGRFYYTVTADVQPGEITAANNKRAFVQTVISKKLKVLYVEGEPRYEFRYLKNAILRDKSLDFACLLLSGDDLNSGGEGNIAVSGFPTDEKSLFEYDIIVIGDVPRSYFSDEQLQAIRRFVEDRGASLLVIAGEQHMPHEYAGTPLEAVLPANFSPSPDPITTDEQSQWQLTPEGRRSPITQLEDDSIESDHVWQTLPGMFWAAGVQRVKPGATVLAVHPTRRNSDGPYPLALMQPFGAGKCYMELVDSTWRWRWRVGDRYFYRYWGQVFRTLTPKELPGNSRYVQMNADRNSYLLGDRVQLNARLLDAYYHPIKVPSATATITTEGGQTQHITLQSTPGSPGLYTAQYQPDHVGKYDVSVISPVNPEAKAGSAFVVETLALERQKPELDEPFLKKVAAAGGGKYYGADQLERWMRSLKNNPLSVHSEQEIELWSAPGLLMLFLLPLSIEWLVRKRKGLL